MNRQLRFEPRSSDSNPGPPTIGRAANIEVSRRSYVERRPSVRAANPGLAAVGSEKSCVGVMPQADWRRGGVKTFLCAYFIKLLFWHIVKWAERSRGSTSWQRRRSAASVSSAPRLEEHLATPEPRSRPTRRAPPPSHSRVMPSPPTSRPTRARLPGRGPGGWRCAPAPPCLPSSSPTCRPKRRLPSPAAGGRGARGGWWADGGGPALSSLPPDG